MNNNIIEKIMSSDNEYWVVWHASEYSSYVVLVCIPDKFLCYKIEEIKLGDAKKLWDMHLKCIHLNGSLSPFQYGFSLSDTRHVFPLNNNKKVREFLIKALSLNSDDVFEYEKMWESLNK